MGAHQRQHPREGRTAVPGCRCFRVALLEQNFRARGSSDFQICLGTDLLSWPEPGVAQLPGLLPSSLSCFVYSRVPQSVIFSAYPDLQQLGK